MDPGNEVWVPVSLFCCVGGKFHILKVVCLCRQVADAKRKKPVSKRQKSGAQQSQGGGNEKQEQFEVECIMAKKGTGRNVKYLIKWYGYSKEESTWGAASPSPYIKVACKHLLPRYLMQLFTLAEPESSLSRAPHTYKWAAGSP